MIVNPPWTNQDLVLYHGTDSFSAESIIAGGVNVTHSYYCGDFGIGFYCTTQLAQATVWSIRRASPNSTAAIIAFTLQRDEIANLDTLSFILAEPHAEDFWSLVQFCRRRGKHHGRDPLIHPNGYDCVFGPVSMDYRQRVPKPRHDQVSFHTTRAQSLLNSARPRRIL